jgi:hypothetical protein
MDVFWGEKECGGEMEVVSQGGEVDESVNGGCYDFRAETGWLVGSRFGKEKGYKGEEWSVVGC